MLGVNALIDIARYWQRWSNPQLVICVLNNGDLNQVTWEQRAMSGDPKLDASQALPDFPYARYAELLGLEGIRVDAPDAVGDAWDSALNAGRPTLLEAVTGPGGAAASAAHPLRAGQALAHALMQGDPASGQIVRHSQKGKLAEFVTR